MNQPRNGARVLDDLFNGRRPAWERRLPAVLLGSLTLEAFGDSHVCLADSGYPQPTCAKSCQTIADCDLGSAAFGADNYACGGGACKFLGCKTDAECQDTFDASYLCP